RQKEIELINEIKEAEKLSKKNENIIKTNTMSKENGSFKFGFIKSAPKNFTDIEDLEEDTDKIALKGHVYELNYFMIKNGAFVSFDLDDGSNAVSCKVYVKNEKLDYFKDNFKEGMGAIVSGVYKFDDYAKTNLINVSSIEEIILPEKVDLEANKRIEFNIHTKYTQLESVVDINNLFKRLKSFGHNTIGVTDLFNVQAYPEIYKAAKKNSIKLNLGLQTNIYEDFPSILTNYNNEDITNKDFVVFDIETTGLSNFTDKIIEIGAVKIRNQVIIDKYQRFVNPKEPLSDFTTELTGITNEMVINEKEIHEVLPDFLEFCSDSVLVAQNAEFDLGFIIQKSNELGIDFKPVYVDTLYISRAINPEFTNHKLGTLATKYKVALKNHHRAIDDAIATGEIFIKMIEEIKDLGYEFNNEINKIKTSMPISHNMNFQNIIYARNKIGLKNLYIIVSKSNLEYYNREPGIPLKILKDNREGLLIGTGNYKSKLFKLVSLKYSDNILLDELRFFDFVTIVPKDFSQHLINKGYIKDEKHLEEINKKIIELAKQQNKLFIAIGDVYYLDKKDYPYRNILKNYPRKRGLENSG
ncbi:MAG: exonuclease domain-containing protein, partial [Helcococcus sp.]|nr:exonuclease domain-containing protein [Helcococcus sp.]